MPNSLKCRLKNLVRKGWLSEKDLERIVIIPIDATNEDVIKAMFPNIETNMRYEDLINVYFEKGTASQYFEIDWWNAKYKGVE